MEYTPSLLPEIDAVEVVDLEAVVGNRFNTFMREAATAPCVWVGGEAAENIARLWRQLPPAEPMRCHTPPYGFRFYKDDDLILQASVCWNCNNIFIDSNGQELGYTFDGAHPDSRELLALAKQIMA
jgi:hypothetical protein